jgi:hypothetical protein
MAMASSNVRFQRKSDIAVYRAAMFRFGSDSSSDHVRRTTL